MREILFRGERLDNGDWVYGYYVGPVGVTNDPEICDANDITGGRYDVDPATVGQYTGLTDKNGVKIFEGDIVRTKYGRLCIVVWFPPKLCFDLEPICNSENLERKAPDKWDLWDENNLEVVVNINDNPELLEEES